MADEGEDLVAGGESNYSDRAKRARIEYKVGSSGGHDAVDTDRVKTINIPNERIGVITGEGGETTKNLQLQSGATIYITHAERNSTSRKVFLMGTLDQIAKAEKLINDVLTEAGASGFGIVPRRLTGQQSGADQFIMMIPNNKVGLVVGKEGETIKSMQATTGARIQAIPLHLPPGDMSKERTVQIDGTSEQIEAAKQLVEEVTRENNLPLLYLRPSRMMDDTFVLSTGTWSSFCPSHSMDLEIPKAKEELEESVCSNNIETFEIPLFPRPLVTEVGSKSAVGSRRCAESKTSRGVSQNIQTSGSSRQQVDEVAPSFLKARSEIVTEVIMMSEEDHLTNDEFLSAMSFIENLVPDSSWIHLLLHPEIARKLKAKYLKMAIEREKNEGN